ncbi:MAG: hypothetical protein WB471_12265, partial [Nocardioides sp.]
IVPVAILGLDGSNDATRGLDPAATPSMVVPPPATPTTTPEQTPSSPPDRAGLGFDYLDLRGGNTVLHLADGTTRTLPGDDYVRAAVLGDQIAAFRQGAVFEEGFVDLVEAGTVVTTYDVRSQLAITPDGRTVAFITADDELLFVNGEHGEQTFGSIERGVTLSAIIGDGDCSLETGCHPFLEHQDLSERDAYEINYEGPDTSPAPGAMRVNDAADGFLVTVQTDATDTGSCGGLYDREGGGRWVFETCDAQVLDLSPTGDHVVGTDPYGDGIGPGYFAILDSEGDEVARYEADQGYVHSDFVWADATHAVAVVSERGQWKIISLATDGSSEVVLGPIDAESERAPFLLTGGDAG